MLSGECGTRLQLPQVVGTGHLFTAYLRSAGLGVVTLRAESASAFPEAERLTVFHSGAEADPGASTLPGQASEPHMGYAFHPLRGERDPDERSVSNRGPTLNPRGLPDYG